MQKENRRESEINHLYCGTVAMATTVAIAPFTSAAMGEAFKDQIHISNGEQRLHFLCAI